MGIMVLRGTAVEGGRGKALTPAPVDRMTHTVIRNLILGEVKVLETEARFMEHYINAYELDNNTWPRLRNLSRYRSLPFFTYGIISRS